MFALTKRKLKIILLFLFFLVTLCYFGVFTHLLEQDYEDDFHYPYDGDIELLVHQLRHNKTPDVPPMNNYYHYNYYRNCSQKCKGSNPQLVYLVKSAPEHFTRRHAIRNSWGYERRFSDVEIRVVFLIGDLNSKQKLIQGKLEDESRRFSDIVWGNFSDSYYNNTYKIMMGFHWSVQYCASAQFYLFVDDDYYVSTKNLLRFVRNPTEYPQYLKKFSRTLKTNTETFHATNELSSDVRLYSGFAFKSSPHRHYSSKWYISLEEYPYHMWPPYVTAGAIVLSRSALLDMFYASFYTKHFRFDDIYVSLLALKSKIEPFHCDEFYIYKPRYDPLTYRYVVASHGYGNPEEMLRMWTQQRDMGNA